MSLGEGTQAGNPVRMVWVSDPNRLLPGEVLETVYLEDADHWVRVYEDLVNWVVGASVTGPLPFDGPKDGQEQPDPELLRAHLDRLCERLRFWEDRVKELRAGSNKRQGA
ncbi:MAG: hypothetical protein M3Z11_10010 [Candidatus Dormibacteraeota bacterium]|nr:hypothetical protein [Candidatus Dormibacteraeota bacterium]